MAVLGGWGHPCCGGLDVICYGLETRQLLCGNIGTCRVEEP